MQNSFFKVRLLHSLIGKTLTFVLASNFGLYSVPQGAGGRLIYKKLIFQRNTVQSL